jgi:hypothetical protein
MDRFTRLRAETAEAELRTARAELEGLQRRLAVHDRLAAAVMAYMRGEGVTLVAAEPDAGWCYDMAAAPSSITLLLAQDGYGSLHTGHRDDAGAWWYSGGAEMKLLPYAWCRVQAPPPPGAHQVPPVGSKL